MSIDRPVETGEGEQIATDTGTVPAAGGSARAEFDRRSARHHERARRQRPFLIAAALVSVVVAAVAFATNVSPLLGWFGLAVLIGSLGRMVTTPNHVTAWATGADGEERTAAALEPLVADGFRILHDRRIPGSRANIDHIVIGPPGVFVVESKSFSGTLEIRGSEVYVAGRRRTAMLDEVRREVAAVEAALGPEFAALGIRVMPLICVHRAELPLFRSEADGIPIVSAKGMVKRLRAASATLDADVIGRIASIANARVHPAGPRERVG